MNNTGKPASARATEIVLSILIIIAVFFIFFFTSEFVHEYKYTFRRPYEEASYRYALEDGDYGRFISMYKEAEPFGRPSADMKKYYEVGDYFYCTSVNKIMMNLGNEEQISYWSSRQDEAAGRLGSSGEEYISEVDWILSR